MTIRAKLASLCLAAALISGAIGGRVAARAPIVVGGYRVLAADFHTHSSLLSDGLQTPFGLVLAARAQGLDAIAITGHNEVVDAKAGRWFSVLIGGPTVLVGQEMLGADHHIIAVGTEEQIGLPAVAAQIAEVHRQGGVTIVAHPTKEFWSGFDDAIKEQLDGAEICHPVVYNRPSDQAELEQFSAGHALTAVGSSDFHGLGRIGVCRTFVFAADNTAPAIIDALRAHRTVVYSPNGKTYGDRSLAALIADRPDLRRDATTDAPVSGIDWISRVTGVLGLALFAASRTSYGG